jgi:hypothetical protein
MSLQTVQPPKAAVTALNSNIAAHLSQTTRASVSSYKPIKQVPVYVIDQSEPISIREFDQLTPAAWRFVLYRHRGHQYATGDVTSTGKSYQLSAVTTNQAHAQELLAGIDSAEQALQHRGTPTSFELRILEAPAFHVRALWLHNHGAPAARGDLFSMFTEPGPKPQDGLVTTSKLIELLNKARSAKLENRGGFSFERELGTSRR